MNNIWHVTRRLTALRICFLSSTMLALASLVVLIINGLVGLQDSIKSYEADEDQMASAIDAFTAATSGLIASGQGLVQSILDVQDSTATCSDAVLPYDPTFVFPAGLSEAEAEASESLANVELAEADLTFSEDFTSYMDDSEDWLDKAKVYIWISIGFASLSGVPHLFFMLGAGKALYGGVNQR